MQGPRRIWHALFGHTNVKVDLAAEPWSATCACGYRLRVSEFSLGKIGGG